MSRRKKVRGSAVVSRSRELRGQARNELLLSEMARRRSPAKSAQLCRRSDELVRRGKKLCEQLRKIRDAA